MVRATPARLLENTAARVRMRSTRCHTPVIDGHNAAVTALPSAFTGLTNTPANQQKAVSINLKTDWKRNMPVVGWFKILRVYYVMIVFIAYGHSYYQQVYNV